MEIRLEDFLTATPEIIAGLAFVAEGSVGGLGLRWMSWRLGDAANVSLSHAPCSVRRHPMCHLQRPALRSGHLA